ncbi:lysozyme inhibitor LprI family protein [Aquabacterium sp.]|uniref:lysozyme inhibitor LprI family protein n=1 Tax=Aquabacterium sp. TaxID=1872578 RepID=UPI0040382853
MSNQEKYYEHKVREIEKAKSKEDTAELVTLSLYAAAALAVLAGVLIILSPGAVLVYFSINALSIQVAKSVFWVISAIICVLICAAIYFLVKDAKKTILTYLIMCAAFTATAIYAHGSQEQSIAERAIGVYIFGYSSANLATSPSDGREGKSSAPVSAASIPNQGKTIIQGNSPIAEAQSSAPEQQETKLEPDVNHDIENGNDTPVKSTGPSFSCKGGLLKVEEIVCGDAELSSLDLKMSNLYKSKLQQTEDKRQLKSEQLDWVIHSMRQCTDKDCLLGAYQSRIEALEVQ